MDEQPSRRYPTALGFASALEQAAHGKASEATAVAPSATPVATTPPPAIAPAIPVAAPPVSAADEEPDEDIAAERDEDDAHHQLTLRELHEAASREELEHVPDLEMDEDSEAEAEADRFAADDFLLDAAGAASVPPLTRLDEFSTTKRPGVNLRALDEDHDLAPAESPSPLFESPDLRHEEPKRHAARPVVEAPPVPPPSFGGYQAPADEVPGQSNRPAILTLVFGLLVGLVGGYALWGRSSTPAPQGRDFSEQVVSPPAPSGGTTAPAPAPNTPTTAASKPGASGPSAVAPPPVVSEPPAGGNRATPPASPARGATPPRAAPAVGTITVRSTPVGAGVTVNGRWRGRTPLVLEQLPVATYDVRVVQAGYTPARQAVAVTAADPDHVVSLRLQQTASGAAAAGRGGTAPARGAPPAAGAAGVYTGTVFVDSRPRGARVFIDGKPVGETPLACPTSASAPTSSASSCRITASGRRPRP